MRNRWELISYLALNFILLLAVHSLTDLPIRLSNWEAKAEAFAHLTIPNDNFYPPGSSLLLIPFLWSGPDYFLAIAFYFLAASTLYFFICDFLVKRQQIKIVALLALSFNPYLLWLVETSQDTVFELFLLLSVAALLLRRNYWLSLMPLYLLCLTRPAYWTLLLLLPFLIRYISGKSAVKNRRSWFLAAPAIALMGTLTINTFAFGSSALATESGLTAHFSHNKYYYLSMPKFDMDFFLSQGGNMDPEKVLASSERFMSIKDKELRAALISIVENPKSVVMNTMQKVDSYFFAVQKNPQLSGFYYLSEDQKTIIIKDERLTWTLILGNALYFLYRSVLLIAVIVAITLYLTLVRRKVRAEDKNPLVLLSPYFVGVIPGVLYYTESRFKIVAELLLIPVVAWIFSKNKDAKAI